ncbi:MAG: hypothetical protein ACRD96_12660 [Bryobacteraceae bacterium]
MNLIKAIQELREERERIDRAISRLEKAANHSPPHIRTPRVWSADARRAAAERMRRYWEQRRSNPPRG